MNNPNDYQNLNFERQAGGISRRNIPLVVVPIGFTILWVILPAGTVYWLTLLLIVVLTYTAGFGWEQALANLIRFLQRQQRL